MNEVFLLRKTPLLLLVVLLISFSAQSQTLTPRRGVKTSPKSFGYYESLPEGYNNSPDKRYPLLVFIHGIGEVGNGDADLDKVLANGPPKMIKNKTFPKSFTVNGEQFSFIVLSPQFVNWADGNSISMFIDYAIKNYRVDEDRVYLTGLSMGGGAVVLYTAVSKEECEKVAAIVTVCEANKANESVFANVGNANLPVWATHNQDDNTVSVYNTIGFVNGINSYMNPPIPQAKMTIFQKGGHDAWSQTYDPNFREDGKNVYEWMLQFERINGTMGVLAVNDLKFSVSAVNNQPALKWETSGEKNNLGFTVERSLDGKQFDSLDFVRGAGNRGGNYYYNDNKPQNGRNYYRLKIISTAGEISYSEIAAVEIKTFNAFSIYPNPTSGVLNIRTSGNKQNSLLRIFSMSGKVVLEKIISGAGTRSVNLNFPAGAYAAVLIENGEITSKKSFVKQ